MDRTIVGFYFLYELVASFEFWMVGIPAAFTRFGIYGSPDFVLRRLVRRPHERHCFLSQPFNCRMNRPYFEELTQEALRHGDLTDVPEYYSRQPASGFWILEYGDAFVGLIAIDATQFSGGEKKSKQKGTKPPKTALIRHFHVEEAFRTSNIQDDLLNHAVNYSFEKDAKLERIEAPDSPLIGYLRPCLRSAGFELDHHTKKVGLLRWNLGTRYLQRKSWNKEKDSK